MTPPGRTGVTSPRAGRPRSARIDAAVPRAALELLGEVGLARMTMEALAERAGVSKAAVYRRWSSREDVVADALDSLLEPARAPDTGALRTDLYAIFESLNAALAESPLGAVLPDLVAEAARSPRLRAALGALVNTRRRALRVVLERAWERGELRPDAEMDDAFDLLAGALFFRSLVSARRLGPARARALVDALLDGVSDGTVGVSRPRT